MDNFTVTGRSIDDCSAACSDTYMASYYYDISCLDIIEIAYLCITSCASPAGRSHITLAHAYLLKHQYTKPEQSRELGPFAPHTYGLPSLEDATEIRAETPAPEAGLGAGELVISTAVALT